MHVGICQSRGPPEWCFFFWFPFETRAQKGYPHEKHTNTHPCAAEHPPLSPPPCPLPPPWPGESPHMAAPGYRVAAKLARRKPPEPTSPTPPTSPEKERPGVKGQGLWRVPYISVGGLNAFCLPKQRRRRSFCLNGMVLTCWCSAGNEGMTPVNHPLRFPLRESLGSFLKPWVILLSTSKSNITFWFLKRIFFGDDVYRGSV